MNNAGNNSLAIILNCYLLDEVEFFLFSLLESCYVFVFSVQVPEAPGI